MEVWDDIDLYKVKYLLKDPRFPSMPTYTGYLTTFATPRDFGDNYGARIMGFFVPKETGKHKFYLGE